jgi:hypothetical protein
MEKNIEAKQACKYLTEDGVLEYSEISVHIILFLTEIRGIYLPSSVRKNEARSSVKLV